MSVAVGLKEALKSVTIAYLLVGSDADKNFVACLFAGLLLCMQTSSVIINLWIWRSIQNVKWIN